MTANKRLLLIAVVFAVFAVSCVDSKNDGGTTTGNPLVEMAVTNSTSNQLNAFQFRWPWLNLLSPLKAVAVPPTGLINDLQGNGISLEHAYVVVKEIEFKEAEVADGVEEVEVGFQGPYVINLFAANPSSIGYSAAVAHPVRRIKMSFHKLEAQVGDEPAELVDNSVLLIGTKNGNNFQIRLDEGFEYEIAGPNAISLDHGELLLVTFKLPALIAQIDLSAMTNGEIVSSQNKVAATNPCPAINSSSQDLYTCFKDGLKRIGEAGVDSGRDGQLDAEDETVD